MSLKSLKIPIGFLITGIIWAILSDPAITTLTKSLSTGTRDIIRSVNDFVFVGIISVALYFQIRRQHSKLVASMEQYQRLFELNPNPMWIYHTRTLGFVKVNQAAIDLYGYTLHEFLSMTTEDIRLKNEQNKFETHMKLLTSDTRTTSSRQHEKKSGEVLHVTIVSYDMDFNGMPCSLVMINNVTELILNQQKIKAQNDTLQYIAWSNSHEIRRVLCSVISLVDLLKNAENDDDRREYIKLLEQSSSEIDVVIRETNKMVDSL